MMAFLASFLQYLIIMIILIAIGLLGAKIGIKMAKNKNAADAAAAEVAEASSGDADVE